MEYQFDSKFVVELLKQLPVQVFWKDIDGVYLGCNDAFVRSLGLSSQDDIVGKTDFTLPVKVKEAAAYRADDLQIIKFNRPKLNIEEEQTFASGEKAYLLTSKVPLSNENGEIIGVLGIYSDITELKLAQQQLEIQKEKAEIANKTKTEFIANMSHDLRTPITGMLGMVQDMINTADEAELSLSDKKSPQNANSLIKTIINTVQHDGHHLMTATDELLQLCNEILDVVRVESGNSLDGTESFDLRELIKHNIDLLQPVANHKKLFLSYIIDQQMPHYLRGARIYFDRVLLNLISNALKFTKEGAVKVSVTTSEKSEVGEEINIQISVEDTGIGIPKEKFDTIFEHFSRLTPAYEGLYKGAGLGLYTVKRYIEAMNGSIHVESELGKGTCFTARLPFTVSDHADRVKQSVHFPKATKPTIDKALSDMQELISTEGTTASILIVEDNALAAVAVKLALKSFNCSVEIAKNGERAVKMAHDNHYDLILMDIGLPDISGIEVTRKIRALSDPIKSQVPIVALTGHAENSEMRQESLDAGMQEVLSKPAQYLALEAILQEYVFKIGTQKPTCETLVSSEKTVELLDIIDWDACVHMCNGDPDSTYKMLSMLAVDLENTKAILAEAYANNDLKALRAELHRARGGVCYLKVPQLEYALRTFHETIKVASPDPERLKQTCADLQEAIDAFQAVWKKGEF